jgi:squalene-hopene/tetraprenyl-beta-curcumene cyclase
MVDVQKPHISKELPNAVTVAVRRTQDYFERTQTSEGYWWGELESNPTMEAEYLLLTHFLGIGDAETWRKLANHLFKTQREDGTWGQYYGSPGDLSTSVECYFALKLAGISREDPRMVKAKEFILSKGGVPQARVFTKIWLALFGQWSWKAVPTLPPEMVLIPSWIPMNLYDFSSWARGTMLPLSIVFTQKPICPVPDSAAIPELIPDGKSNSSSMPRFKSLFGISGALSGAFWWGDRALRWYNVLPWHPMRRIAIKRAVAWIVEHQEDDGSWGGIQPPWVYSLIALKILGYGVDHPVMQKGVAGFKGFTIEENDTLRVQACVSPAWDTCLAMIALEDSGLPSDSPILKRAGNWLMNEQVTVSGDWQVKAKDTAPGGWAFEFANNAYPDIDDTAEVLIALNRVKLDDQQRQEDSIKRGAEWMLGVQSKNGGWAAFDKDNTRQAITKIPFADFGEMIDPPSADVTAHVVEALARLGYTENMKPLARAIKYLWDEQEPDGSWFGRWGVNYIYGIGAVLPALEALNKDMSNELVRRAVDWLFSHQNEDGGWGESCASYGDPSLAGQGPSTASQTGWALMALMAAGEWPHNRVHRGLTYLVDTQKEDGTWYEPWFTGTGFPGYGGGQRLKKTPRPGDPKFQGAELPAGFMINYHLYRNYWPLMALGRFKRYAEEGVTKSTAN